LDFEPEAGLATAKSAGTAVVLFIDELQHIKEDQFAALISAVRRCTQSLLPVTVVGAGPLSGSVSLETLNHTPRDFSTFLR
jgi:hypothetical protein